MKLNELLRDVEADAPAGADRLEIRQIGLRLAKSARRARCFLRCTARRPMETRT